MLKQLAETYPEAIAGYDAPELSFAPGERLKISDGRIDKTFEELLDHPDIDDMFAFSYPAGSMPAQPPVRFRSRTGARRDAVPRHLWRLPQVDIQKTMREIDMVARPWWR